MNRTPSRPASLPSSARSQSAVRSRSRWCARAALSIVSLVLCAATSAPAGATTLIRSSVEDLTKANRTVVVGEVLDSFSYWNDGATFILTEVEIAVHEVLKGEASEGTLTVTLMGGTVGELSTLILGGAKLEAGHTYVLFLNEEDLPGAPARHTVRDHCQGVFDLEQGAGGLRAVSQANGQFLLPDSQGFLGAPGGVQGFPIASLSASVRSIAEREAAR